MTRRPGVRVRLKVRMLKTEVIETLRMRDVEPAQVWLRQATAEPPLRALPMPRMAETEARRPHPPVCRRACQDRLREN